MVKIDSARLEASEQGKKAPEPDTVLGVGGEALDGILVPGGFGQRGTPGMVAAASWARNHNKPYFGICLGMQIMVIEWARHILGWGDADSAEFKEDTSHPVISLLQDQVEVKNYGGTKRLGAWSAVTVPGSQIAAAYKTQSATEEISERHRHRYEFSNKYRKEMTESGLLLAATTPDKSLVECVEWPSSGSAAHPWGLGVQFHPEFKSKPTAAAPLFRDFIAAVKANAPAFTGNNK
jgi:CTP synthase